MFNIHELMQATVAQGASDLHLAPGRPPLVRIRGELEPLAGQPPLERDAVHHQIFALLYDEQKARLAENLELDFSYELPGVARFRVNAFLHRHGMGAALRVIPGTIPSAQDILLPEAVMKLADLPHGLVLITGATGSGKSTTMACVINTINQRDRKHILTIEDPIEFAFPPGQCLVTQREVGATTHSFHNALRAGLRQDPDVVLVGELRDLETIGLAMTAAETGHLVFATLHTSDAPSTIDRVIDVFPPHQQQQIRYQLSNSLKGVVCQHLLPRADGRGRVAAREIMIINNAIANLVRTNKAHEIPNAIMTGAEQGMVRMDQDLLRLVKFGLVDVETARPKMVDQTALLAHTASEAPKKKGLFG